MCVYSDSVSVLRTTFGGWVVELITMYRSSTVVVEGQHTCMFEGGEREEGARRYSHEYAMSGRCVWGGGRK